MDLDLAHLRALAASVSEGTFEAAARVLHVTPSAVSQRIRALEIATGRVLLVRSKPIRVTESGEAVLRLARQVEALTDAAARELGAEEGAATLPIAVNADSLATWVLPALAPLAGTVALDIRREDQEHTGALLRAGAVMGAITAEAEPLPGCTASRLGAMRYRPMAAPGFTIDSLSRAPMVVFDRNDTLQHVYLSARLGEGEAAPPVHYVPASAEFMTAIRLGYGWGMLPDLQADEELRAGRLVIVDPEGTVDVDLHWQQWRLRSPDLDRVADAIRHAAATHLR